MFTIEHGFDSSTIVLIDEGAVPLAEDVTINAFDDCVTIEQFCARTDTVQRISLSMRQVKELAAALNLPEGTYRGVRQAPEDDT